MKSHANAAVWTGDHGAALMALQKAVITAAVDEHDALPARVKIRSKRSDQPARERHEPQIGAAGVPSSRILSLVLRRSGTASKLFAQIDHLHARQRTLANALCHTQNSVAPGARIGEGFSRRCRGPQHDWTIAELRERNREITRVVANPVLLFIGGIVLLVDHDEAEVEHRREKGRARSDYDMGKTLDRGAPAFPSLSDTLAAVSHGHGLAEPLGEGF